MNKLSIIVPCYNEEEVVALFYQETLKSVTAIQNLDYEFIFIDDGSKDNTYKIMQEYAINRPLFQPLTKSNSSSFVINVTPVFVILFRLQHYNTKSPLCFTVGEIRIC